jgi:hypothetical protein
MKHTNQTVSEALRFKILGLILLFSFVGLHELFASEDPSLSQTLRGKVVDEELGTPLIGANIVLSSAEEFTGTVADLDGRFEFTEIPVGRHQLQITFMGYETRTLSNILVNASKQVVFDVKMRESVVKMKTVEITAKKEKNKPQNELALISARGFSVEETQRYAGSFDDPGRMAQSYAGVAAGDDGSNEPVIRGNSPRGVLWKMEGMEIPNPNHFSEQGSAGGAISMLKGSMMANSDFFTGAFPAEYGNATSGVFDVQLRKGNNQQREYGAQIGLLGVEGAIEGLFKAGYEGSYLVNYRYSTLDMLRAIGIDVVGDQIPVFQDLAYNVSLPTKKFGNFTLFGVGGISYVTEEWDGGKDVFETNMGVSGFTHKKLIGKKMLWSTTGGFTTTKNHYFAEVYDSTKSEWYSDWNETFLNRNFRISSNLNYKLDARNSIKSGLIYSNLGFNMRSTHYATKRVFMSLP